ncbi:hypothetical protein FGO68_gene17294 [Halteria grandinella]|uniref:Uncharacterized protein n=1 Tax=Halteria grandinella TaxID=5974 RepID=A0A8J8SWS0_HALGN|nr:hypothetical protein FGO68_gene17294 [Halteria grandinella]
MFLRSEIMGQMNLIEDGIQMGQGARVECYSTMKTLYSLSNRGEVLKPAKTRSREQPFPGFACLKPTLIIRSKLKQSNI